MFIIQLVSIEKEPMANRKCTDNSNNRKRESQRERERKRARAV